MNCDMVLAYRSYCTSDGLSQCLKMTNPTPTVPQWDLLKMQSCISTFKQECWAGHNQIWRRRDGHSFLSDGVHVSHLLDLYWSRAVLTRETHTPICAKDTAQRQYKSTTHPIRLYKEVLDGTYSSSRDCLVRYQCIPMILPYFHSTESSRLHPHQKEVRSAVLVSGSAISEVFGYFCHLFARSPSLRHPLRRALGRAYLNYTVLSTTNSPL